MKVPPERRPEEPDESTLTAATVAALVAVDPVGLGGACLRAPAGPARDLWLERLRALLPQATPWRRLPLHTSDAALLGGLDLGATLQSGHRSVQPGLLAQADGGLVVLAMAERVSAGTAAKLASVLDRQELVMERDGMAARCPARLGVIALDEGVSDDEGLPPSLKDRLAFRLTPQNLAEEMDALPFSPEDIHQARQRLPQVRLGEDILQAICAAAMALGVHSMRGYQLAIRAARAAAALAELNDVAPEHARLAAQLVLAHRATQLPAAAAEETNAQADDTPPVEPPSTSAQADSAKPPPSEAPSEKPEAEEAQTAEGELADTVLEAAQAAIPAGLLAALRMGQAARVRAQSAGRAGASLKSQTRGRPIGSLRKEPRQGQRLNVIDTLRAAAPWQRLRAGIAGASQTQPLHPTSRARIRVLKEDFHVTRFRQQRQTTTLFVVDASGSSALHRLAEAKGAVELLLAECYVRRDQVALLAFRGKGAELLLPPTRSLTRAKRSLAALAGGGGTPLASGLAAALELAQQVLRRGETPVMVLLTDGRANIGRNGQAGRPQAIDDALVAAGHIRSAGIAALLLDTSPQAQSGAQTIAHAMGGTYLPLPYAGAQELSRAVQWASGHPGRH